jgi:hypothetical protein
MTGVHPLRRRKHRRGKRKRKVVAETPSVPLPVAPSPTLASLRQRLSLLKHRAS